MSWERPCERDSDLPARAGEIDLAPFGEEEILDLIGARLLRSEFPLPARAAWEYARWKPGVSITAGYTVGWADGHEQRVVLKRYVDGKDRDIERSFSPDERSRSREERLDSFAAAPELRLCLYAFPADRALPGAARLLHLRRTARLLNGIPFDPERRVRGSRCRATVLRYKPERRAVFRLDLALEDARGEAAQARVAARALPPAEAARVSSARAASVERSAQAIGPRLIAAEERTGILIEQWLDVDVPDPTEFGHAFEAGGLAARLHALPLAAPARGKAEPFGDHLALFAADPDLLRRVRALRLPPRLPARAWIHGDLHPDQVVRERASGSARLLDLDALAAGHPAEDLSTWIADHLAHDPGSELPAAQGALLEGYRAAGGSPPAVEDIQAQTALSLVRRAAAALRRLERGAVVRAAFLLDRAEDLLATRGVPP